jgi:multidrug resistance efflux pump
MIQPGQRPPATAAYAPATEAPGAHTPGSQAPGLQNGAASQNGSAPGEQDAAASWSRQLTFLQAAVIPTLLITMLVVFGFAALYWSEQTFFVATDNAIVAGDQIAVAPPAAGQIRAMLVDVGDAVERNQLLATVVLTTSGAQMQLRSPIDGVVVARAANIGETVQPGRALLTVVDPTQLWIEARVEDARVGRVHAGQRAEVWVDSVGGPFGGTVIAVAGASNASAAGQTPAAGPFIRLAQWVPVRIQLDPGAPPLVVGGLATARIRVDG